MSLTISGYRPMNYAISNAASFSDAYTNSIKQNEPATQFGNIEAVQPVMYPNAQEVSGGRTVEQMQRAVSSNKAFNEVASGFAGTSTGYNGNGASSSYGYEMLGSTLDLFA